MNWIDKHWLHLILIGLYLIVLVRHALHGKRNVSSIADYLVAGRRMGGVVIALSFYATFMSTNTFIGAAGKSWTYGLSWCVGGVVLTALAAISWFVVAPRFVPLTKKYQSLTVADFAGFHYDSQSVRRIAAMIVAFASLLYLVAIYRGASIALERFLDVPYVWCVILVLIIVTGYTLMGGFESVVLTDAIQGVLMLIGAVALVLALLNTAGGFEGVKTTLLNRDPKLLSWTDSAGLAAAMSYALAVGVKYLVEPRQLSRMYGLRDAKAMRTASIIAPVAILVTYLCLLPLGAIALSVLDPASITNTAGKVDTDQIVPALLSDSNVLGTVVGTLFLLVLISAAMSSIDSVLLVAAAAIDRDLLNSNRPDNAPNAVARTRIWVVIVSVAAAVTALQPFASDIVSVTKFSGSLYGACFVPVIILGLFQKRRSAKAAKLSMILGGSTVITAFTLNNTGVTSLSEVYPGMIVGVVTFLVASAISFDSKLQPA